MSASKKSEDDMRGALQAHLRPLWRFALSLSGAPDVADDLVQATCLRAMERAEGYRDEGRLKSWLMTICRSIWLNELRAARIRQAGALDASEALEIADLKPDAETNIFAAQVFTQVMALPEAQRVTVELVYVQQYTYREAAEILDVPIGTVMSRLAAARQRLAALNGSAQSIGKDRA